GVDAGFATGVVDRQKSVDFRLLERAPKRLLPVLFDERRGAAPRARVARRAIAAELRRAHRSPKLRRQGFGGALERIAEGRGDQGLSVRRKVQKLGIVR